MKKLTLLTLVALLASLFVGPTMQASSPTYSFNLNPPQYSNGQLWQHNPRHRIRQFRSRGSNGGSKRVIYGVRRQRRRSRTGHLESHAIRQFCFVWRSTPGNLWWGAAIERYSF